MAAYSRVEKKVKCSREQDGGVHQSGEKNNKRRVGDQNGFNRVGRIKN
jgi:hypothetical protein